MITHNTASEESLTREIAEIYPDPHPTQKTHFYCMTSAGRKSLFDQTVHEFLKANDRIPVVFSKGRTFAIPQFYTHSEIEQLKNRTLTPSH